MSIFDNADLEAVRIALRPMRYSLQVLADKDDAGLLAGLEALSEEEQDRILSMSRTHGLFNARPPEKREKASGTYEPPRIDSGRFASLLDGQEGDWTAGELEARVEYLKDLASLEGQQGCGTCARSALKRRYIRKLVDAEKAGLTENS